MGRRRRRERPGHHADVPGATTSEEVAASISEPEPIIEPQPVAVIDLTVAPVVAVEPEPDPDPDPDIDPDGGPGGYPAADRWDQLVGDTTTPDALPRRESAPDSVGNRLRRRSRAKISRRTEANGEVEAPVTSLDDAERDSIADTIVVEETVGAVSERAVEIGAASEIVDPELSDGAPAARSRGLRRVRGLLHVVSSTASEPVAEVVVEVEEATAVEEIAVESVASGTGRWDLLFAEPVVRMETTTPSRPSANVAKARRRRGKPARRVDLPRPRGTRR